MVGQLPLIETPKSINQVPSRNNDNISNGSQNNLAIRFQSKLSSRVHPNGSQQRHSPFLRRPQNRRPPRYRSRRQTEGLDWMDIVRRVTTNI
jgi:hypothetical protein